MVEAGSHCSGTRSEDHGNQEHNNKGRNHRPRNKGHRFGTDWNRIARVATGSDPR